MSAHRGTMLPYEAIKQEEAWLWDAKDTVGVSHQAMNVKLKIWV